MKRILLYILLFALCLTVISCNTKEQDTESGNTSTADRSSVTSTTEKAASTEPENETTTETEEPYVSTLGVKVYSDISKNEIIPYEILNATHYFGNDGFIHRGTGRESTIIISDFVSFMPHMKIKKGFSVSLPEDVTCGDVALYNLDGTLIKDCENLSKDNFAGYMQSGTEYIAKFYVTKESKSDNGKTISYYMCYIIVGTEA